MKTTCKSPSKTVWGQQRKGRKKYFVVATAAKQIVNKWFYFSDLAGFCTHTHTNTQAERTYTHVTNLLALPQKGALGRLQTVQKLNRSLKSTRKWKERKKITENSSCCDEITKPLQKVWGAAALEVKFMLEIKNDEKTLEKYLRYLLWKNEGNIFGIF